MGYSKAEVDTYIMKWQNEIEEYRFHEAAKDRELAQLELKAIKIKKMAQQKAEQIEQEAREAIYPMELGIQKSAEALTKINQSANQMLYHTLIDFETADTSSVNKHLDDIDYELTRKLYYLKGLPLDESAETEKKTKTQTPSEEKTIDFASRTILQHKSKRGQGKKALLMLLIALIAFGIFYFFQGKRAEALTSFSEPIEPPETIELLTELPPNNSEELIDGYAELEPVEVLESVSFRILEPIYSRKITDTEYDLLQISQKVNPDFVFWLKIEDTHLNCPVVQGNDNEFYLNHSFDGSENSLGTIFMDAEHDPFHLGQNTFIYAKARHRDALLYPLLQSETKIETIHTIFEDGVVIWEVITDESEILSTDQLLSIIPVDADPKYTLIAKLKKP